MDRLLTEGKLDHREEMYLDALSDLVGAFEDAHHAIEPASDAGRSILFCRSSSESLSAPMQTIAALHSRLTAFQSISLPSLPARDAAVHRVIGQGGGLLSHRGLREHRGERHAARDRSPRATGRVVKGFANALD